MLVASFLDTTGVLVAPFFGENRWDLEVASWNPPKDLLFVAGVVAQEVGNRDFFLVAGVGTSDLLLVPGV